MNSSGASACAAAALSSLCRSAWVGTSGASSILLLRVRQTGLDQIQRMEDLQNQCLRKAVDDLTRAGMVLLLINRIPRIGDVFQHQGWTVAT